MSRAAIEVQYIYKVIQYMLLMQYPAENNILKFRASEEAVKQMGDVAIYHRLCFVGIWPCLSAPLGVDELPFPVPIGIEKIVIAIGEHSHRVSTESRCRLPSGWMRCCIAANR